jgi:hypothetical protein
VVIAFDDVVGIGWRVVWGFICIGTWVHWCCYIHLSTMYAGILLPTMLLS